MKTKLYKNIALSFIVINIWTLYNFFDYYNDFTHDKYGMSSMTLFFNFIEGVYVAILFGIAAILLRLTIFRKQKRAILRNNFFYVLTGLFNFNVLVIFLISIIMGFLPLKTGSIGFLLGISIIAGFILFDMFREEKVNELAHI